MQEATNEVVDAKALRKEQTRAREKAWRESHKEHLRAYRESRRDETSRYNKAYKAANWPAILAKRQTTWNENRETMNARQRIHRAANHEKILERERRYAKANSNRIKEKTKARRQSDPMWKERRKQYRERGKDKSAITTKAWKRANPGKIKAYAHRARARRIAAPVGNTKPIAAWIKAWRAKRVVQCYWCRLRVPSSSCHTDHIMPLAKGGVHCVENLCVSCASCNRRKNAKPLQIWNATLNEPVLL